MSKNERGRVDSAQYKERTNAYDFDMTPYIRSLSLSPGNEQMLYWGSAGVSEPGTRNWMGMNSPAAEAMIKNPKTISQDAILDAALALMEKHSITQLPTVDSEGKLAGVLHLHDILKSKLV